MESKYHLANSSIYLPGTSVPKNKLDITDLNEIHELERTLLEDAYQTFYELNGRITRLFFDIISIYNGYEFIDYSISTPDEYIRASIDCVQFANFTKLQKIIESGLKR